jgi:peroxiredoxin
MRCGKPAAVDRQRRSLILAPDLKPRGHHLPAERPVNNPGDATHPARKGQAMTIKVGDKVPSAKLQHKTKDGIQTISTDELFKGKKVVLFALPGAFTPTCSAKHLPGFVNNHKDIKSKGVDTVACLSVNDAFVMDAWGKDQHVEDKVMMLADGNGEFTKAVGLTMDGTGYGMGLRSQRYAMVIEDGVVKKLNVEAPGAFEVSSAEAILKAL